jgi:hypothetical protein
MPGEPPTPWDLQRQINDLGKRQDRSDDRILTMQREFVTSERLDREIRHVVEDVGELVIQLKEVTTKLDSALEKQRERDDQREKDERSQRRNLTYLALGWLISLIVAVSSPIIVQAVTPG